MIRGVVMLLPRLACVLACLAIVVPSVLVLPLLRCKAGES